MGVAERDRGADAAAAAAAAAALPVTVPWFTENATAITKNLKNRSLVCIGGSLMREVRDA